MLRPRPSPGQASRVMTREATTLPIVPVIMPRTHTRNALHAAAAFDTPGHFAADRIAAAVGARGAGCGRRRSRLPGGPQWLRQIDAAADRGRAAGCGRRPPLRSTGDDHTLSAAGTRSVGLSQHARVRRGGPRHGRRGRPASGALSAAAPGPDGRRDAGRLVGRRSPPGGTGGGPGAGARHSAARRADQPSGSARHRLARI